MSVPRFPHQQQHSRTALDVLSPPPQAQVPPPSEAYVPQHYEEVVGVDDAWVAGSTGGTGGGAAPASSSNFFTWANQRQRPTTTATVAADNEDGDLGDSHSTVVTTMSSPRGERLAPPTVIPHAPSQLQPHLVSSVVSSDEDDGPESSRGGGGARAAKKQRRAHGSERSTPRHQQQLQKRIAGAPTDSDGAADSHRQAEALLFFNNTASHQGAAKNTTSSAVAVPTAASLQRRWEELFAYTSTTQPPSPTPGAAALYSDGKDTLISPKSAAAAARHREAATGRLLDNASTPQRPHHHNSSYQPESTTSFLAVTPPTTPQMSTAAAGEQLGGFNDPRLIAQLQQRIHDRLILEQLLVLQDEYHCRGDILANELSNYRHIVLAFALTEDQLELEAMQKRMLDKLMMQYATSNFVPEVRHAILERYNIAQSELAEIQDAILAVRERTELDSQAAEDQLVDLLTTMRSERTILMDQIHALEEQRRHAFEAERDKAIDVNFSLDASLTSLSTRSQSRGTHGGGGGQQQQQQPSFQQQQQQQLQGITRPIVIPRDMWVSKTLPSARRVFAQIQHDSSSPVDLGIGGGATAATNPAAAAEKSRRYIDAAFPMPPLREDLGSIQQSQVPPQRTGSFASSVQLALEQQHSQRQHATTLRTASAAVLSATGSPSSSWRKPNSSAKHITNNNIVAPSDATTAADSSADQRRSSASFYQSFLSAASPNNGGSRTSPHQHGSNAAGERGGGADASSLAGRFGDDGVPVSSQDVIAALSTSLVESGTVLNGTSFT